MNFIFFKNQQIKWVLLLLAWILTGDLTAATLSAGGYHTCMVKNDGTLACWGLNDDGRATSPSGTFSQLSVGWDHACALRTDATLICWGRNESDQPAPVVGSFSQISAGYDYTCALKTDGTLACWGDNLMTPPVGTFTQISTGWYHACGIKTDSTIVCWGKNDYQQATPPEGTFLQVTANGYHSCGIQADSTVVCWGNTSRNQASPPAGAFTQIVAGFWYTCGIKTDGTLACWGENDYGQALPPAGSFVQLSAGLQHACGVKTDGTVTCWGDNSKGQATVPPGIISFVPCTYHIDPANYSHNATAEIGNVTVTAPAGCPWTASSNTDWLTITAGNSGQGNGLVTYAVAANSNEQNRSTMLMIAGQPVTIIQMGTPEKPDQGDQTTSNETPSVELAEDNPGEATEFHTQQLQDENGYIPPDGLLNAAKHIKNMKAFRNEQLAQLLESTDTKSKELPLFRFVQIGAGIPSGKDSWEWLGPGNIGGRILSIVIHPTEPNKIWVGSVAGGIWKTTNGGESWQPINDFMPSLVISSLVMDPKNPEIMYAGTDEDGVGIFKSIDGGNSWNLLEKTSTKNNSRWTKIKRLAVSPTSNSILAVTAWGIIWLSEDAGENWKEVGGTGYWGITEVHFPPKDGTQAIASGGRYAYWSTEGGKTWNTAKWYNEGTYVDAIPDAGRIAVTYAPSSPNIVYASVERGYACKNEDGSQRSGQCEELWKSEDGGRNYSLVSKQNILVYSHVNVLWVDPTNPNTLIVGGVDLWRSMDGGRTFIKISDWHGAPYITSSYKEGDAYSVHADHHVIVSSPDFDGSNNKTVFFGNDGGIYKTDDVYAVQPLKGWQELNNRLGITWFYSVAGNPNTGVVIGGCQDNGIIRYTGNKETWTTAFYGDGGFSAVDSHSNIFYSEIQWGGVSRIIDNREEFIYGEIPWNTWKPSPYLIPEIKDRKINFIAPLILDPNNSKRLLVGADSLWITENATAPNTPNDGPVWRKIKEPISDDCGKHCISAIVVAKGNSNIIWVGHNNGDLYKTENGGNSWVKVDDSGNPKLPDRMVNRITLDPNYLQNRVAYISFTGFSKDNLWRTNNDGLSWSDITGNDETGLPDVPIHTLVVNPANPSWLYVGTEIGLFTSENGGGTWSVRDNDTERSDDTPSNVAVYDLSWLDDNTLLMATYGRGIYKAKLGNVSLEVAPGDNLTATGDAGGPFSPNSIEYTLLNAGNQSLGYKVYTDQDWITLSSTEGQLEGSLASTRSTTVTVSINDKANTLQEGQYHATVYFNSMNNVGNTTRSVTLIVKQPAEDMNKGYVLFIDDKRAVYEANWTCDQAYQHFVAALQQNPNKQLRGYCNGQPLQPPAKPPKARFTVTPARNNPLTVTLDASSSYDLDGTIIKYEWSVNGQTLSGQTATTTFPSKGTYQVTLTVTDNQGLTDKASQMTTVFNPVNLDNTINGSGNLITRSYDFKDFTWITAYVPFAEISVVQSNSYRVQVTADDNLIELLNFYLRKDTLYLDLRETTLRKFTLKIAITMPTLNGISLEGTGPLKGYGTKVRLSGFTLNQLGIYSPGVNNLFTGTDSKVTNLTANLSKTSYLLFEGVAVTNADIRLHDQSEAFITLDGTGTLGGEVTDTTALTCYGKPTGNGLTVSGTAEVNGCDATNTQMTTDCSQVTQIPPVECQALLAFYQSTNGPNWKKNNHWNKTNMPCNWYGVGCKKGHVGTLYLTDNNLVGTLPPELNVLSAVTIFWFKLCGNQLRGPLPDLSALSVEWFCLNNNQLSGHITTQLPKSIGNLSLANNQFTGPLPESIGNVSFMLDFYNNHFCGEVPRSVMKRTYRPEIGLSNNHLIASDPEVAAFLDRTMPGWEKTQTPGGDCAVSNCTYTITPTTTSHSLLPETGTLTVTAPANCPWTASSNEGWISITSGNSGQGNGTITYSVAGNTGFGMISPYIPSKNRTGTMTIAEQTVTVNQKGEADCTYTITPTTASHSANFETGTLTITAPTGCNWYASSNDKWISITSEDRGQGNGTVTYSVADNTGAGCISPCPPSQSRSGTISIAGQTVTVTQNAIMDLTNGLVAYYPFNGNANDESGNGNSGTVDGATLTEDRFGNLNSAYSFDGVNDKIYFTQKHFARNNQLSVSVWLKANPDNKNLYFAMCSDFGMWNRGIEAGLAISLPGTDSASGTLTGFGEWNHLVGTYDGTYIQTYINGNLTGKTLHEGTLSDPNRSLTFGVFSLTDPHYWAGVLDDIRIYNRVLSETEVRTLFNDNVTFSNSTQFKVEVATPLVSQAIYQTGDTLRVTLPLLPVGQEQYIGIGLPNGSLYLLNQLNSFIPFDNVTFPVWSGGEVAIQPVTADLPSGLYTVYLLRMPTGVSPASVKKEDWALGTAMFTVASENTPIVSCDGIVGKWQWFNDTISTFYSDGTSSASHGYQGTWQPGYVVTWHRDDDQTTWVDTLTLSPDGQTLDGQNQNGNHVWGTRLSCSTD